MKKPIGWLLLCCLGLLMTNAAADKPILTGHPRHDYLEVPDIEHCPESRWIRMTVLTVEGYMVVADEHHVGQALSQAYHAGPVWHLARVEGRKPGRQDRNWFGTD